jgi:hypothetical protein
MSKPQKRCVFCRGTPATKGHIWPEWLTDFLPPRADYHQVVSGEFITFQPKVSGQVFRTTKHNGHAGSRKPRNTCADCNGGWMSRIEQSNVSAMSALITGRATLLTPIDQWLLACLLCLITIRLEFTDRETQAVPVEERNMLRTSGAPPFDSWRIWIAKYAGENPEDHWSRHAGMHVVSSPDEVFGPHKCNAQVSTMVIGKLCAHLVSSSAMPVPGGYHGVELTRIWPAGHFHINSSLLPTLDEDEIVLLHESFPASLKTI